MATNRRIYATSNLFIGPTPATGYHFLSGTSGYTEYNKIGTKINSHVGSLESTTAQNCFTGYNLVEPLHRIQTINHSAAIARTDVNQFGELVAIDRIILEQPTVNLEFSYLSSNLHNERLLGFTVCSGSLISAISGILDKSQLDKNYFIKTVAEGKDVVNYTVNDTTTFSEGIGNGFIASYRAEGSVGNFPTVSVSVQGLNYKVDSNPVNKTVPAVFPTDGTTATTVYTLPSMGTNPTGDAFRGANLTISALRPGDVVVDFGSYGGSTSEIGPKISDLKVQSYSLGFDLNLVPLQQLGSKYAFSREIDFPVTVNCQFTANVGDLNVGSLVTGVNDDSLFNVGIKIYKPNTTTRNDDNVAIHYMLRSGKLDSIENSANIGDNKSTTLSFSSQLGSAESVLKGLFISGLN